MKRPFNRHIKTIILPTLLAAGLTSCSNGGMTPTEPDPAPRGGSILFGGSMTADSRWVDGRGNSRAGAEIDSEIPDNIGVFAFGDGPNTTYIFRNQKVLWRYGAEFTGTPFQWDYPESPVDVWPYTTEAGTSIQRPWENMRYKFFAYSPWHNVDDVNVTAETYSGFNTFQWDNIPGFTAYDYVLSNEISDVDNRAGEFTSLGNIVHFSMRHILSRIRFFFRTTTAYHQVRRIELNSLTVMTAGKVKSATFNFKDNAWDETVHWSNEQSGDADPVTLTNLSTLHYFIPVDYPDEPFTSVYVYPQSKLDEIKMQLDYTVYDSEGIATRRSQLVSSVMLPDWELLSGYYYDIRVLVSPDYLYVLSDNDQDFDGYVIIKDTTTP